MFSCEYCEISKKTFFTEHFWTTTSESPHVFSLYFSSSLFMLVPFICSINVNLACLLRLWPGNRKCWSAWSNFCLLKSFRWLFSVNNYFIFTCVLFVAWHILFGILGIYFCNWGYCMFWRFCVWRHFWLHLCTT